MRYQVGSARVTRLSRSTRLLAETGVFYSFRIRVKVKLLPTILSTSPGRIDLLSISIYAFTGRFEPAYSP